MRVGAIVERELLRRAGRPAVGRTNVRARRRTGQGAMPSSCSGTTSHVLGGDRSVLAASSILNGIDFSVIGVAGERFTVCSAPASGALRSHHDESASERCNLESARGSGAHVRSRSRGACVLASADKRPERSCLRFGRGSSGGSGTRIETAPSPCGPNCRSAREPGRAWPSGNRHHDRAGRGRPIIACANVANLMLAGR